MSHSAIICESALERESQSGRPPLTPRGFGSLVSNEPYIPTFIAVLTFKPDPLIQTVKEQIRRPTVRKHHMTFRGIRLTPD